MDNTNYQPGCFGFPAQAESDTHLLNDLKVANDLRSKRFHVSGITVAAGYKDKRKCIDCDKRHATGCLRCQRCQSIRAGGSQPIAHRSIIVVKAA